MVVSRASGTLRASRLKGSTFFDFWSMYRGGTPPGGVPPPFLLQNEMEQNSGGGTPPRAVFSHLVLKMGWGTPPHAGNRRSTP